MRGMQRKSMWCAALSAVVVVWATSALATDSYGFHTQTLAKSSFAEFAVGNRFISDTGELWLSAEKTKGDSDGYVSLNTWDPGGYTGWHTHPGHTLVFVIEGAITQYEAADPTCTPHVYSAGMAFIDRGGNHVHNVRNETNAEARVYAIRLVPAGQKPTIDIKEAPGNCPF